MLKNDRIVLPAPAKINLFLQILGRRSDGYHDLETWMQKLDLHDTITLQRVQGTGIEFSCDSCEIPGGEGNLAVKAAMTFLSTLEQRETQKLIIHLEKRIPVAAGLGGGSSDAGTVLRGLNRLYGQRLSDVELVELARSLGADVPFFAVEHNAVIARGIGDIMCPVDSFGSCTFILVNPGFLVSTRWVFENFSLTSTDKKYKLSCSRKFESGLPLELMHNDLEEVTGAKYSEIDAMEQMLLELGASKVLMSGSGPTVFGVFPDSEKMKVSGFGYIVGELSRKFGERVFVTRAEGLSGS